MATRKRTANTKSVSEVIGIEENVISKEEAAKIEAEENKEVEENTEENTEENKEVEELNEDGLDSAILKELAEFREKKEAKGDKVNTANLRAFLNLAGIEDSKEQSEYIEAIGFKGLKRNFAELYYDYLAEKPRTKKEASDFILGKNGNNETSRNVQNHLSHYLNIHSLSIAIWNKKSEAEEEKPEEEKNETEVNKGEEK